MKHLLGVRQLEENHINQIFALTKQVERDFEVGPINKTMISFFGEPSTRTRLSFEAAAHHLGMKILTAADASVSSSLRKGESWKDTFRTLSQYGHIIVCRHPYANWTQAAKLFSRIPVINAGNGADEHPTQALLDLYTIWKEFGTLRNLKIMLCGDLKYGRTVHSLVYLLRQYYDAQIYTVPAKGLELPLPSCTELSVSEAADKLGEMDVVYMTRLQTERTETRTTEYFRLRHHHLAIMKDNSIILHPLPRGDEISEEVDDNPRAIYHEQQAKNGLYVRVALLKILLDEQYNIR